MKAPVRIQPKNQRGVVLFVGLIMLILITLLAITSFNLGSGGLESVGNMQARNQATSAAQQAIDAIVSTSNFVTSPQAPLPLGGGQFGTQIAYDVNGDANPDVTVNVDAPVNCVQGYPIEASKLDLTKPADVACTIGVGQTNQNLGVAGASHSFSYCAETVWEIHAVATDAVTNAKADVTEGVGVRVAVNQYASKCGAP